MKKIENLTVTVHYSFRLSDLEVDDNIYEQMALSYDAKRPCEDETVMDWIEDKVQDRSACWCSYSIDNMEEE